MRAKKPFFCACRGPAIIEKPKTSRAGSRHAGEAATSRGGKKRQYIADNWGKQAGRRLHVVAAFAKGSEQCLRRHIWIKFGMSAETGRGARRDLHQ